MFDPQKELLISVLAGASQEPPVKTWVDAGAALSACGEKVEDLAAAVKGEDRTALRQIVELFHSGQRPLPEHDRELLKAALKAFRKRLKLTVLDAESSIGGGPLSAARNSSIVGIKPPELYPRPVWEELARQKRLVSGGHGTYELPPGA